MRVRRTAEAPTGSRASFDLVLGLGCPGCHAPLMVEDGMTAVACPWCKASFLIAPRIHPLEVVVAPTVAIDDARLDARAYLRAGRHRATWIGHGGWRHLPYWRYRAKAFQWMEGRRQAPSGTARTYHDLEVRIFDMLLPATDNAPIDLPPRPGTFAASPLNSETAAGAPPARVTVPLEAARVRAHSEVEVRTDLGGPHILKRRLALVGEEMLLVHLPFFCLEYRFHDEVNEVLVDGIAGGVISHHQRPVEPITLPPPKTAPPPAPTEELFLPLICPSCNQSLPLAAEDQVHSCAACGRAWETDDEGFVEVEHYLALTAGASTPGARYVPFWVVNARAHGFSPLAGEAADPEDGGAIKVYVPAFESRQFENHVHLGVRLTRSRLRYPVVAPAGTEGGEHAAGALLYGASIRRSEAERLAWVILGSLATADPKTFASFIEDGSVEADGAELHWLPFRPSGLNLHEPSTGIMLRRWEEPRELALDKDPGPASRIAPPLDDPRSI